MGVVYGGRDLRTGARVAIKLLRIEGPATQEQADRFVREVKHTARLTHPHVVKVLDLGRTEDGVLYFVMELLEGYTLRQLLEALGCRCSAIMSGYNCSAIMSAFGRCASEHMPAPRR
jgi:serine/threonine-protein kinase